MTYAIGFRILAVESEWDDMVLQGVFLQGFAENLNGELRALEETSSLK